MIGTALLKANSAVLGTCFLDRLLNKKNVNSTLHHGETLNIDIIVE